MPTETPSSHDSLSESVEVPKYDQVIPIAYAGGLENDVTAFIVKDVKTGVIARFSYYKDNWETPTMVAMPDNQDEEDEAMILIAAKGSTTFLEKEDIPEKPISREDLPEFAKQLAGKLNKKKTKGSLKGLSDEVNP